ncbi:hypothetical protein HDV05_003163 [Chytridiales sp. JEL 0842]|nr:hypothetical protein HDV05_003163 [Chytridiales sp. JEL 0842]
MSSSLSSSSPSIVEYFNADNRLIFGPEEKLKTEDYYAKVTKDLPLEVKYQGEPRGKGVFAKTSFRKGDQVLLELGIVGSQHEMNKAFARVCQHCMHFVGTPQSQMELLLERPLTEEEKAGVTAATEKAQNSEAYKDEISCECGEAYCSEDCRAAAWKHSHALLCPIANPTKSSAIATLKEHCLEINDIFYVAAKVYADIALRIRDNGKTLQQAVAPYRMFVKAFWWDVAEPSNEDEESREEFRQVLKGICKQVSIILKDVFDDIPELHPALNQDFLGLLIGLFERNNLSTITPSPLLPLLDYLPEDLINQILAKAKSISNHHEHHDGCCSHEEEQEDEDDTNPYAALNALIAEGTALHVLQGSINHHCEPNAMVFKESGLSGTHTGAKMVYDGRTVIRALRDIQPGEEITISYIDEGGEEAWAEDGDDSEAAKAIEDVEEEDEDEKKERLEWRALSLREYGIEACKCKKCTA